MNETVKITIVSARKLEKMGELFATVGAILWSYLNPLSSAGNKLQLA